MAVGEIPVAWRVIAHSVRGASHVRSGLPNQDAFACLSASEGLPQTVVAISDGHGSEACFRSDVGSKLAVWAAVDSSVYLLAGIDQTSLAEIQAKAEQSLAGLVIESWRRKVARHLKAHPFTESELAELESKRGLPAREEALRNTYLAYGATLQAALLTQHFGIFFRIGDGEIILAWNDAERPTSQVFEADMSMLGDATHSLCREGAENQFHLRFESFAAATPDLVLLCTDGYEKSFKDAAGFLKVGKDLWNMLRTQGVAAVEEILPSHLNEVTTQGAGDDTTLAFAWQPGALARATTESAAPNMGKS